VISFLEVCHRAQTGPIVREGEFDVEIFYPAVQKTVQEHDIAYDADCPVVCDDRLADAVFAAAMQLLTEVGIYCSDTHRIIQFSEQEVRQAIEEAPGGCQVGEGDEAKTFRARKPEDPTPPWCHLGNGVASSSEELASKLVEGYGRIKHADSVAIPALLCVDGQQIAGGSPLEIEGAIRSVVLARQALRRSGRSGLPILNLNATASSAVATIASSHPAFGVRPSDGWLVGMQPEMKVSFEALNKVTFLLNWGANIGAETSPMLGGYAGGPEGTAVANTAYALAGILVLRGAYHLSFPLDLRLSCSTTRGILWAVGVSGQAISRHLDYPFLSLCYTAAGPATRMYFYETAAYVLDTVVSGLSPQSPIPARGVKTDHSTPLEMQFAAEVAHAAAGMKRETANDVVLELLAKYENDLATAPPGKKYQECYDLEAGQPDREYQTLYEEVKNELCRKGVPFG